MIEVTESYDLSIYTERAIRTAIRYYASICNIVFRVENGKGVCCFMVEKKYADRIVREFGNFLIELLQRESGDAYGTD